MEPAREGTQTGIALDGSGSMSAVYGLTQSAGPMASLFGWSGKKKTNEITPVAQKVCSYLAGNSTPMVVQLLFIGLLDRVVRIVQVVGDLTAEQAASHEFGPPEDFGTGTQLLPAVKYFCERFKDAPWVLHVFTDGELHDLDEVKRHSVQLAKTSPRSVADL
jgi:hypothetical protein